MSLVFEIVVDLLGNELLFLLLVTLLLSETLPGSNRIGAHASVELPELLFIGKLMEDLLQGSLLSLRLLNAESVRLLEQLDEAV